MEMRNRSPRSSNYLAHLLKLPSRFSPSSPSPSQVGAADLLSLLGRKRDAARIPDGEAREFQSRLRFLVPFSPLSEPYWFSNIPSQRDLLAQMVCWPPAPVLNLARLAVASGGDPRAIRLTLDPTVLPVPDVEGLKTDKCQLTRTPYGRRFDNEELNWYFAFLFELIVARARLMGLDVSLSRYDLFHGHLFVAPEYGRLGILFHAKEYPAYDEQSFPCCLGHCQTGSDVVYDDSMNLRNILWLAPLPSNGFWVAPGALVVLDAHPEGIIYEKLVPESVGLVRTIYEGDFGQFVADINYLNMPNVVPQDRIFIC